MPRGYLGHNWWRLGLAAALGCASALSGFIFGMPGHGEFVPAMWLAGFAAILVAPGWLGFSALVAGGTITGAIMDVADGVFGLVVLIVVIIIALAGHGALVSATLLRLRRLGWSRGSRDQMVLLGFASGLGLLLIFVWAAGDFARNPP